MNLTHLTTEFWVVAPHREKFIIIIIIINVIIIKFKMIIINESE